MPSSVSDRLVEIFSRQTIKRPVSRRANDITHQPREFTQEKRDKLAKNAKERPLRTLEILKRARNRVQQGWIAHEIAVDKAGHPVEPDSAEACTWCMSGAIQAAAYELGSPKTASTKTRIDSAARQILYTNLGARGFRKADPVITLASLNDNIIQNKRQAVEFFDNAIAEQERICKEKGLL